MQIHLVQNRDEWEIFLQNRQWRPFLQSYTMGEVYRAVEKEPIRLEIRDASGSIVGVCQSIVVNARRGRHLSVLYGPVLGTMSDERPAIRLLVDELRRIAEEKGCTFVRVSPFWPVGTNRAALLREFGFRKAPLHLLAEHIWYLDLLGKTEEDILAGMRKTTRNLIRRAEKEGVVVAASKHPDEDIPLFFDLYEETRKRHRFVPYGEDFIRAQVKTFSIQNQCVLYIARYRDEPVAASVHMIYGGETSYHHGASSTKHPKCFASYLLQWRAIQDALKRGDRVYNFWGIAPEGKGRREKRSHPFAGVTTFKKGFGGELLELQHCMDLPFSQKYWITYGIEMGRKWRRGF